MNNNKRTESAVNLQNDRGKDHQFSHNQYNHNSGDWQYDNADAADSSVDHPFLSGDSQSDSSYLGQQRNSPYRSGQCMDSTLRGGPSRDNSCGSKHTQGSRSRDNSMRGGPSRGSPYRTHPYRRSPNMDMPARERINSYRTFDREILQSQSDVLEGIFGSTGGNTSQRHDSAFVDRSYNGNVGQVDVGSQGISDFLVEKLGEYSVNSGAEAQQALKVISMFLKPIQEYNIKLQDAKAIALVSVAEMNIQTLMERDVFS
nr:uncharacterized protein LOC113807630 isoform X1 [Penaeus vannamei]